MSACTRAVKELIRNDHIERRVLFLQRADSRGRQNTLDAEQLHPIDVRTERQVGRRIPVPAPMPRQKRDLHAFERPQDESIRWVAVWRLYFYFLNIFQLRHLVEAAAANDADLRCCHLQSSILI